MEKNYARLQFSPIKSSQHFILQTSCKYCRLSYNTVPGKDIEMQAASSILSLPSCLVYFQKLLEKTLTQHVQSTLGLMCCFFVCFFLQKLPLSSLWAHTIIYEGVRMPTLFLKAFTTNEWKMPTSFQGLHKLMNDSAPRIHTGIKEYHLWIILESWWLLFLFLLFFFQAKLSDPVLNDDEPRSLI